MEVIATAEVVPEPPIASHTGAAVPARLLLALRSAHASGDLDRFEDAAVVVAYHLIA